MKLHDAIEQHKAAVVVDEASFDASGTAVDVLQAEKTGAVERAAFIEFVSTQCYTSDGVQEKLRYLLDGTVGERGTHLECLIDYSDDLGLLERFLRSLIIDASRGSLACACDEVA